MKMALKTKRLNKNSSKSNKRKSDFEDSTETEISNNDSSPSKKQKFSNKQNSFEKATKASKKSINKNEETKSMGVAAESSESTTSNKTDAGKSPKPNKTLEKAGKDGNFTKKPFQKGPKDKLKLPEKPEDWAEFKKKKKALRLLCRQKKEGFDVIVKAKDLVEKIRRKTTQPEHRNILVNQLHGMLKGQYVKFALAHDTSRLVQCALKYGSTTVRNELSKEVIPITVDMMQSKYGKHIVQRMLKHGEPQIRSQVIQAMYGSAVKLSSHVIASPILECAYSTWATSLQKHHLVQEFYSDMYKNSKDDQVKHMRDVYATSPSLKPAVLSAVKENMARILNKKLYDSGIVQTLLCQYLTECSEENRADLISQIVPHIVVISNSRDGSRAAIQCIWHGTNKEKKVCMRALKEHIVDLCKHEYGHCTVIALLDSADDTVWLHKVILKEILEHAKDLASNEWGRKVLLWLVAPGNTAYFHPQFVQELEAGRAASNSKKEVELRRKELLQYAVEPLLALVKSEPEFWLKNASLALEMLGIVKAGFGSSLQETYRSLVEVILNPEWTVLHNEIELQGIEHPGLHMVLKKLAQHDKVRVENEEPTFGAVLVEKITKDVLKKWIQYNRGCFILLAVYENNTNEIQNKLKEKLRDCMKTLKKQTTSGAKILLSKVK